MKLGVPNSGDALAGFDTKIRAGGAFAVSYRTGQSSVEQVLAAVRASGMHIKDIKATTTPNMALKMDPADVGAGRLDWKTILPAAHKAGVRNFFLEQEPPFATPRMEAAENGYKFLSTLEA